MVSVLCKCAAGFLLPCTLYTGGLLLMPLSPHCHAPQVQLEAETGSGSGGGAGPSTGRGRGKKGSGGGGAESLADKLAGHEQVRAVSRLQRCVCLRAGRPCLRWCQHPLCYP